MGDSNGSRFMSRPAVPFLLSGGKDFECFSEKVVVGMMLMREAVRLLVVWREEGLYAEVGGRSQDGDYTFVDCCKLVQTS